MIQSSQCRRNLPNGTLHQAGIIHEINLVPDTGGNIAYDVDVGARHNTLDVSM